MYKRIIARLDIKGPNLVKGVHLEGLRVLGKPETFAKYYYESGADELMYQDVVASLYERNSLNEIISKTAKEIFIPLTVGGGIRSIEDIKGVLRSGADKVSINTAVIKNPKLIQDAAKIFGSSTIVVSIEAIKQKDNTYFAFIDNGREFTGQEVISWAKKVVKMGAGEILITSVDKEGTGDGCDLELLKSVSDAVSVPVIGHGGVGKKEDVKDAFVKGKIDALAIASIIHYDFISKHKADLELDEGDNSFLKSGNSYSKIIPTSIIKIKKYLDKNNILCRVN